MNSLRERVAQRRGIDETAQASAQLTVRDALGMLNAALVRMQRESTAISPPSKAELARCTVACRAQDFGAAATRAMERKLAPGQQEVARMRARRPRFGVVDILSAGTRYFAASRQHRKREAAVQLVADRQAHLCRHGGKAWLNACSVLAGRAEQRRGDVCRLLEMVSQRRHMEAAVTAARGADFSAVLSLPNRNPMAIAAHLLRHGPDMVLWKHVRTWTEALDRLDSGSVGHEGAGGLSSAQRVLRRMRSSSPPPSPFLAELLDARRPVPHGTIVPEVSDAMVAIRDWRRRQVPEERIVAAIAGISSARLRPDPAPVPAGQETGGDVSSRSRGRTFARQPAPASIEQDVEAGFGYGMRAR